MTPYKLGAHVMTDLGAGVVIGRSIGVDPSYSVRLTDGTIRHSIPPIATPDAPIIKSIVPLEGDVANIRLVEIMPRGLVELLVRLNGIDTARGVAI